MWSADVDTSEVGQRVLASIKPFSSSLLEIIVEKPDWYVHGLNQSRGKFTKIPHLFFCASVLLCERYGPFWISTTLVFLMSVMESYSHYLNDKYISTLSDQDASLYHETYSPIQKLTSAAILLWG